MFRGNVPIERVAALGELESPPPPQTEVGIPAG